jgi:hypothetical protein
MTMLVWCPSSSARATARLRFPAHQGIHPVAHDDLFDPLTQATSWYGEVVAKLAVHGRGPSAERCVDGCVRAFGVTMTAFGDPLYNQGPLPELFG